MKRPQPESTYEGKVTIWMGQRPLDSLPEYLPTICMTSNVGGTVSVRCRIGEAAALHILRNLTETDTGGQIPSIAVISVSVNFRADVHFQAASCSPVEEYSWGIGMGTQRGITVCLSLARPRYRTQPGSCSRRRASNRITSSQSSSLPLEEYQKAGQPPRFNKS